MRSVLDMKLNPLRGQWHPPLGPVVPLLCVVTGVALLTWFIWWATRNRPSAHAVEDGSIAAVVSNEPGTTVFSAASYPSGDHDLR
ncbi:hypothetical protein ABT297_00135 [Dactylosporangium sp. NPDC000555]|uniref:hypothetical protein n=1 Tax=Dactylosporangium sp. NPDC000555 TaxID=3154260 RepID=UPI003324A307